ncbi:RNaseH domain-containing protein [Streptomyces sp. NPDC012510]|uniref:RNaseH domain-containing protein n=1 Tax=Streptomyces sp. NPDC012510 TaxID=3364838 RepID=UPI0036F0BA90
MTGAPGARSRGAVRTLRQRTSTFQRDRLGLDGGPVQRIGLYGKQLRVIRIADGSRDETAQCWVEAEEFSSELEGKQRGGIAMGLWRPGLRGDSDRVLRIS